MTNGSQPCIAGNTIPIYTGEVSTRNIFIKACYHRSLTLQQRRDLLTVLDLVQGHAPRLAEYRIVQYNDLRFYSSKQQHQGVAFAGNAGVSGNTLYFESTNA